MVLNEVRREDLKYTEHAVKGKIDRVITELSGSESAVMTKLAGRFKRLQEAIKKMTAKRNELGDDLKEKVKDLFNAEDVVLTRVINTAQFVITLSKDPKQEKPKMVTDYQKVAEELAKLIPTELEERVKEIYELYTQAAAVNDKGPGVTVKDVKEGVEEVLSKGIDSLVAGLKGFVNRLAKWAVSYDHRLKAMERSVKGVS